MQIVAINQSRNSQQVWLKFDSQLLLPFKADDIAVLKLSKFTDISSSGFQTILEHSARHLLYEYAFRQIAISPKVWKTLEIKLKLYCRKIAKKYSFPPELLNQLNLTTLSRIEALGFLDEQSYIEHIIRKYPKKSSYEISYMLRRLGLKYSPSVDHRTEISKIKVLISKKFNTVNFRDFHDKNKVVGNLIRKGFPIELIKTAIDETTQLR